VIAVNGVGMFHFKSNIPDALFGQPAVTIHLETRKASSNRHPNGLWFGPKGPRYRRVSAVLFVEHLTPWSIADCHLELWHNPWADKPLDADWLIEQYIPDAAASNMRRVEGRTGVALFDLETGVARQGLRWTPLLKV
jgi:hypothetical protein